MQSIAVAVDMNTDESTFTIPTMLQVRSGGTTILGGGGTGKKCHQVFVVLLFWLENSRKKIEGENVISPLRPPPLSYLGGGERAPRPPV